MNRTVCGECGRTVSLTNNGIIVMHNNKARGGMRCSQSNKYSDIDVGGRRSTPYLHPEPRLVGEPQTQSTSTNRRYPARYQKKLWQSFICAGCGELNWMKGFRMASLLRGRKLTLEQLRCFTCRKEQRPKVRDEMLQAQINLMRRRKELGLK